MLRTVISEYLLHAPSTGLYNEMVINVDSVVKQLPTSIDGFFFLRGGEEQEVREAHADFLRRYPELGDGRQAGRTIPLLEVDLSANRPFRLAAW